MTRLELEQEPCEDCISRKAVRDAIFAECSSINLDIDFAKVLLLQRAIKDLPPVVTPQKPKTGHWILADEQNKEDVENDNYRFICSECQCSDIHAKNTKVPYCWKCGAKMAESEGVK